MQRYIFILFVLLCISNLQAAELRSWTGSNGKVIEAEFVSYDKDNEIVIIKRADGKEQRVKLSLFSGKDQEFVKNGGKENTDDPFGENMESTKKVIRIRLYIDEYGEGNIQIEKTDQQAKNDFDGTPITLSSIPKAKVLKGKNDLIKITHDFADPDPIEAWSRTHSLREKENIHFNSNQKALKIMPTDEGAGFSKGMFVTSLSYQRNFRLPFTKTFDIIESNIDPNEIRLFVRIPAKENSEDFRFLAIGIHLSFNTFRISGRWGRSGGKDTQQLFLEDSISFKEVYKKGFRLPIPSKKNIDRWDTVLTYGYVKQSDVKPLVLSRWDLISHFIPTPGIIFDEKDSTIFIKEITSEGQGEKAGIQQGDIIKTINGKKPKTKQEAANIIADSTLGNDITIQVERRGEEKKIVVKTD